LTLQAKKTKAAVGSVVFLVIAPGIVAGLIPLLLTGWDTAAASGEWLPLRMLGVVLVLAGAIVLLEAFARFVFEGVGTPAPVTPTDQLVSGGLYRYVRNPMYLAVGAVIVGQGLVLGQPILFIYAVGFALAVAAFVHLYEEPTLSRQFGQQYETYRRAVPAWWPRRRPWMPSNREGASGRS
jgi:protein-S-isoprenylcysteine O-methyltransferase Ste14